VLNKIFHLFLFFYLYSFKYLIYVAIKLLSINFRIIQNLRYQTMKILILITAFNVEKFVEKVIQRLPDQIKKEKDNVEILIIDDASKDDTLKKILLMKEKLKNMNITCLSNKENLGYGGNQKVGYYYAIKNNFDIVVLLHGDGQYSPELIMEMINPIKNNLADAVQGSRMIKKFNALKGGMPLYKFFGNLGLTTFQNILTNMKLSEYHSGYRAYRVNCLKKIPFNLNSNYFHFDTQILIQLNISKFKILEIPIPTFYGEEISSLKATSYGFAILRTTISYFVQKFGIFYDKKFNFINEEGPVKYVSKLNFLSTHKSAYELIDNHSNVLSIGCGEAYTEKKLTNDKQCSVDAIDEYQNDDLNFLNSYKVLNLEKDKLVINKEYNYILFLDVIEHLSNPETFLKNLNKEMTLKKNCKLIISTPNIANIFIRIMLLFGQFNYGKKGILDKTHKRLFTLSSFKRLLVDTNFKIEKIIAIPPPFPLAISNNFLSKSLLTIFTFLNKLRMSLFAFQFMLIVKPKPSLELLLSNASIREEKN